MSQPTTGILLNSTNPPPPDGNQNVKPQSNGAIPLQEVTFFPQVATGGLLGVVKPDGTTILVGPDGTLSANTAGASDFITALQQQLYVFGLDTGTVNAYFIAQNPPPTIVVGSKAVILAAHANTGPSMLTIDSSPVSTAPITKEGALPLTGAEIGAGQILELVFDGTNWQIVGGGSGSSGAGSGSGGGGGGSAGSGLGDVIPAGAIDGVNTIFTIPSDGSPGPGTGTPSATRGSAIQVGTGSSVTLTLPGGSIAGDLAIIFAVSGWALSVPGGWAPLYLFNSGTWNAMAASKLLDAGDISTGSITISAAASFDIHGGLVVFVGPTGGVRETQGTDGAGGGTITNTTSVDVLSSDLGLYFASQRETGFSGLPTITPATGVVNNLQTGTTTNAGSVLASQAMPGGSLAVASFFASPEGGNGDVAIQVIVQNPGGGGGNSGGANGNLYLNGSLQDPLKSPPDYVLVGTTITMRNPPVAVPSPDSLLWVYQSGTTGPPGPAGGGITTLVGDVTAGPGAGTVNATLAASGVVAGTYEKVTVDAKGRVTSGAALSAGDIPNIAESQVTNLATDLAAIDAAITAIPPIPTPVTEVPSGTMNGINVTFTLSNTPNPAASLSVYLNGVWQDTDWISVSGTTITFTVAPKSTDKMRAKYTH
jgi:hypothetical protein